MNFYNEMMDANGGVRAHYKGYDDWLKATPPERIARKRAEADLAFHRVGITFAVYGEEAGNERLIPFDIIPRVIPSAEWKSMQGGLRQRGHRHRHLAQRPQRRLRHPPLPRRLTGSSDRVV